MFGALWLDAQLQLIADEVLFRGSICSTSVHPRELLKDALNHGAHRVILFHSHPSLSPDASTADKVLTERVQRALELVEVKVLDHFIVAGDGALFSFAERGLL